MGKLGSRELTAGSDVDLILLYDHDAKAEESDGPKPLAAVALFHAADAAPDRRRFGADRRGRALRARPSPAAVRQQGAGRHPHRSVPKYQRQEAWTWEHMALTRARVVAGDAGFAAAIAGEIDGDPRLPRDRAKVRPRPSKCAR